MNDVPALEELTPETAGALATRNVPVAARGQPVGDVRRRMEGVRFDIASHVAVCDEHSRLLGVARIEELIAADEQTVIDDVMDADPPVVAPGIDQEVVAWRASQHEESALAVVNRDGRFQGMIPPARLLGVLLREHDEDMARIAGVLRHGEAARTAATESIGHRLFHRLPWLLLGLAGALLAAGIVGLYEDKLEETVLLAFFIPGIVYLADAVGTQTEALIIRGLSLGVSIRSIVIRESMTGVIAGIILALAFFPLGWLRWGEPDVALVVSLSLAAACSTATLVAMALPWAFDALGRDPAFGSGPLATVVQDLLSILIYFAVASAIL
jgi:magnesium transporter